MEILEGRKKEEYRQDKDHWVKRLEGKEKDYTHILFRNGYSANVPEMLVECKKIQLEYWEYKDGTYDFVWVLKLGKILQTKYVKPYHKPTKQVAPEKPVLRAPFDEVRNKEVPKKKKAKAAVR
jgi:hypothetical protein